MPTVRHRPLSAHRSTRVSQRHMLPLLPPGDTALQLPPGAPPLALSPRATVVPCLYCCFAIPVLPVSVPSSPPPSPLPTCIVVTVFTRIVTPLHSLLMFACLTISPIRYSYSLATMVCYNSPPTMLRWTVTVPPLPHIIHSLLHS